ncbi:MAG: 4'-phosphopantetheinyl transferase family protein [Bacteroidota bacterium]
MIGNDIVDLQLAKTQSNWRRRGYLQKIFTKEERQQILDSENRDKMVWLFWSMKEAAYKAWQRKNNLAPKFNPRSLECFLQSSNSNSTTGKVIIEEESVFIKSFFNSNFIHSRASCREDEKIIWKSLSSKEDLRQSLLREFVATAGTFSKFPKLKKDRNFIPQLFINDQAPSYNFSLSHHGSFSGFAFSLNNS